MAMYRLTKTRDGYRAAETSATDEIAVAAGSAAGWLAAAGVDGLGALGRRARTRRLMKAAEALVLASEGDDPELFLRLAQTFVRKFPSEELGHQLYAEALSGVGRHQDALTELDTAVRLGYSIGEAHLQRAAIYREMDQAGRVVQELTLLLGTPEAREDAELRQMALIGRAQALLEIDDVDQAMRDADEAVRALPHAQSYGMRGAVFHARGECEPALDDLNRALQLWSPDALCLFSRSVLLEQRASVLEALGRSAEAETDRREVSEAS